MSTWRNRLSFWLMTAVIIGVSLSSPAEAYCVANQSSAVLHVQALDATGFEADINAGDQTCCNDASCLNRKGSGATLLAVTGYVPVKGAGRPGWKAECRAAVTAKGTLTVTGDADKITCQAK